MKPRTRVLRAVATLRKVAPRIWTVVEPSLIAEGWTPEKIQEFRGRDLVLKLVSGLVSNGTATLGVGATTSGEYAYLVALPTTDRTVRECLRAGAALVDALRDDFAATEPKEGAVLDDLLREGWAVGIAISLVERQVSAVACSPDLKSLVRLFALPQRSSTGESLAAVPENEIAKARAARLRREN